MLTLIAFIAALALLIAVHEYGHYRVAVACGVKVLRFSIGFGKPLVTWRPKKQHPGQDTEFVVGLLPLGGFVKMLDEHEAPVPEEFKHAAFNNKSLPTRAAIVIAGPLANLLLAVLLYSTVNWLGVQEPLAILASPAVNSIAAKAGLQGGDLVQAAALGHDSLEPVQSMEDLRWLATQAALNSQDLQLEVRDVNQTMRKVLLPLSQMDVREADAQMFRKIGLGLPWSPAVIDDVILGDIAATVGLKKGDLVLSISGQSISDNVQLLDAIRSGVQGANPLKQIWKIQRQTQVLQFEVMPKPVKQGAIWVGMVGIKILSAPQMTQIRHGPLQGLWRGVVKTWEISVLSLRMMGKMLIGQASLKNLSGPMTIADVAGKSASLGLVQYLLFLGLISVSLGVLNLLPLPVLDGGHLMYYLWEAVTGKPVSDVWLERLQRCGIALLMVMMAVALFNDVTRIFG
jgi:regulator of sigma E protease